MVALDLEFVHFYGHCKLELESRNKKVLEKFNNLNVINIMTLLHIFNVIIMLYDCVVHEIFNISHFRIKLLKKKKILGRSISHSWKVSVTSIYCIKCINDYNILYKLSVTSGFTFCPSLHISL